LRLTPPGFRLFISLDGFHPSVRFN